MKTIFFLFLTACLIGCASPVDTKDAEPETPAVTTPEVPPATEEPDADLPEYVPPHYDNVTEVNVLRPPRGYASRSASRGIAESDPIYPQCTEPGTIYMFFSEGAVVQYVPEAGFFPILRSAFVGDVEAHNYLNPGDPWDVVIPPIPGPVFDTSNDPTPIPLRIRFLNNDGTDHLHNGQEVNLVAADAAEYATWVYPNGQPRQIIKGTFEGWGASDGISVVHMQLGGDGISIPSATFHF